MTPQETDGMWRLLCHWSGEDDLVDGKWVDKVSGERFGFYGNVLREDAGYHLLRNVYGQLTGNGVLPLGNHYRVVIDARATAQPDSAHPAAYVVFVDFQSLGDTPGGFMCGYGGNGAKNRPNTNDKRHVHDAEDGRFEPGSFITVDGNATDGVFEFANEPYDAAHDVWTFRFNGGEKIYSHLHGLCPQNIVGRQNIWLNRGFGAASWQDNIYTDDILYRDIKIYTERI